MLKRKYRNPSRHLWNWKQSINRVTETSTKTNLSQCLRMFFAFNLVICHLPMFFALKLVICNFFKWLLVCKPQYWCFSDFFDMSRSASKSCLVLESQQCRGLYAYLMLKWSSHLTPVLAELLMTNLLLTKYYFTPNTLDQEYPESVNVKWKLNDWQKPGYYFPIYFLY